VSQVLPEVKVLLQLTGKTGFHIPASQQSRTVCSKHHPMNINIMGVFTPPVRPVSIYPPLSNRAPGTGGTITSEYLHSKCILCGETGF
jgi:hypothetical protein